MVTVQFKKFGVQLNFTPTGTASGAIHLKVKPEVSALDFANAVTVDGVLIPAISSRVAETEVVLKDGESFAIAGLIDNRVTQVISKIKGLGRHPDSRPVVPQPIDAEDGRRIDGGGDAALRQAGRTGRSRLSYRKSSRRFCRPRRLKKSKDKDKKAQSDGKKPELVGPRGYVIAKQ